MNYYDETMTARKERQTLMQYYWRGERKVFDPAEHDLSRFDIPLATTILARITNQPDQHNQSTWVNETDETPELDPNLCNTPHCVAGWSMAYSGRPLRSLEDNYSLQVGIGLKVTKKGKVKVAGWEPISEGQLIKEASEQLGLSEELAHFLFMDTYNETAKIALAQLIAEATRQQNPQVMVREKLEEVERELYSGTNVGQPLDELLLKEQDELTQRLEQLEEANA